MTAAIPAASPAALAALVFVAGIASITALLVANFVHNALAARRYRKQHGTPSLAPRPEPVMATLPPQNAPMLVQSRVPTTRDPDA